jgi:hypothetical protein
VAKIKLPSTKPKFTRPYILSQAPVPKPLHGLTPRKMLGKEWWDKERLEAKQKNNFCCHACGVHESQVKWLEGHEQYSVNFRKKLVTYKSTVSLCPDCHAFIHSGRTMALNNEKETIRIIRHGIKVLRISRADISLPTSKLADSYNVSYRGLLIRDVRLRYEWHGWKLSVNGKVFESNITGQDEWNWRYKK